MSEDEVFSQIMSNTGRECSYYDSFKQDSKHEFIGPL